MDREYEYEESMIFFGGISISDYAASAHECIRRRIHDYLSPLCQPGIQNGISEKLQTRRLSRIRLISLFISRLSFSGTSDAMAMQATA
jgi:hypothetical protein